MTRLTSNWLSAILASAALIALGYLVIHFLPADHPIEQRIEEALESLIENKTGVEVEIDFSKESS